LERKIQRVDLGLPLTLLDLLKLPQISARIWEVTFSGASGMARELAAADMSFREAWQG
jgi:hypothetical protein